MPVSASSAAARELSRLGVAARRLKAQQRRISESVDTLVANAPALSDHQLDRLRSIIGGAR